MFFTFFVVFFSVFCLANYNKGAGAERELMRLFAKHGFAVVRSAGSGKNQLPCPDIVAIKSGRVISLECKARRSSYLSISVEQMSSLFEWASVSGSEVYVAWKFPNKGWFFLRLEDFIKNKHYSISFDKVLRVSIPFEVLIGIQSRLLC